MAFITSFRCPRAAQQGFNILRESFDAVFTQVRGKKHLNRPRQRFPTWFLRKERVLYKDDLTPDNTSFIKDMVHEKYGPPAIISGISSYQQSPLKAEPFERGNWTPESKRAGLIARKIGNYPMWLKDGSKIQTTLLQVVDNHVVRYIPPEEYTPTRPPKTRRKIENKFGCLVVGAESVDPQMLTKEYCGLFNSSGVMPKRVLGRFLVTPDAAIQPGTPLFASHFRVGDIVDVRGKTVDRGFQGVMKRWGFHGMPASHGVTKTHRRGGNIGAGGAKARVWPGTKMPGHMGNQNRIIRGLRIWRINTKYNVMWVQGTAVAGETNSIVYIYDTILPLRKMKSAPRFPTYYPEDEDDLPEEIYDDALHPFTVPTITYQESK